MSDENGTSTMITPNLGELFAALAEARKEFGTLTKNKSASIRSDRGASYSYNYADLNDLIEATAAALAKHGLVIIQEPEVVFENGRQTVIINGCIAHKSGGVYRLRPLPLPVAGNTAQAVGSAISYARRYQLSAVLNLAAADDDGNAASNGSVTTSATHPAQAVRPPSAQRAQNGTPAHRRHVDPATGEITDPDVDFGMREPSGRGSAHHADASVDSTPYYTHAWNQLTGKPYDLVKWLALLHDKSDTPCTVKQYGYLVSLADELSDGNHGYVLSVLCQADISKTNRPGAKVADALFEILPKTIKDENDQKIDNPKYRADIAELIRSIAAQRQTEPEAMIA